jgi:hypothetical protein
MAKLSPEAKEFYEPHFTLVSWIFVLGTTIPIDIIKFFIDLVPVVDLINLLISVTTFFCINLFFFMKLGNSYLGGKSSGQKVLITLATAVISLIPILDGFVPEETLDAASLMFLVGGEDKKRAEARAIEAARADEEAVALQLQEAEFIQTRFQMQQEAEDQAEEEALVKRAA